LRELIWPLARQAQDWALALARQAQVRQRPLQQHRLRAQPLLRQALWGLLSAHFRLHCLPLRR
jgi:hypothetical protein